MMRWVMQTPPPYRGGASQPRITKKIADAVGWKEFHLQGAWAHPWGQGGEFVYPDGVKPPLFHVEKEPVEVVWGSV